MTTSGVFDDQVTRFPEAFRLDPEEQAMLTGQGGLALGRVRRRRQRVETAARVEETHRFRR